MKIITLMKHFLVTFPYTFTNEKVLLTNMCTINYYNIILYEQKAWIGNN